MKPLNNILISGGGTGGHIYPAISIADRIKILYPEANILFVGAKDKMEMQIVPKAGYQIKGLWIAGFQRKISLKNLMFPFKLVHSLVKSYFIVRKFNPDVVIGTGGFASGAVLYIATAKGIPTLIQEQNSYPGITNRILASKVDKICVSYDGLDRFFPKNKIIKTGNPVRKGLDDLGSLRDESRKEFGISADKKCLLIIGGSLGASFINKMIASNLSTLKDMNFEIIWQVGKLYYEQYKEYNSKTVRVMPFIENMNMAYSCSDIIISRAGASSVSELCLVAKPTIFIPSPNVTANHQYENAKELCNKKAAELLTEDKALEEFIVLLKNMCFSDEKMNLYSTKMKDLAKPNATNDIVSEIEKL
ncbi:MAG: undecaprenyldiphospho-muramoylpentapeptide beta-N-acetylglucosaminyltransferase [Flavobacteriaceae bacterium]|nr:undecaprenyldiphospho-muramoylpentapeptide beta-N-acetylglucosaminyltransferase [Flavobacteriaceae bacterium]